MRTVTLVRGARQLLTLRGPSGPRRGADLRNLGIIQDGAVLIIDGVIRAVGPSRRLDNLAIARNAEEIDASGRVVMPGFIDCHTHLVSGPARALEHESQTERDAGEILPLARTIQDLSPRALEAQALQAAAYSVRHGATTIEAKSGFGLTEAGEIKILRVQAALQRRQAPLISTFLNAQPSPEFSQRASDYMDWLCSHLLPLLKKRKLAEFADIRLDRGAFTLGQARQYLTAAQQCGFQLKIHTGGSFQSDSVLLAAEFRVVSIDHLTDISELDAATLAQSPAIAVLLPGPAFFLENQTYPAARRFIESGVAVALATNYNPETSPSQNMQMMIALACGKMKMTAAEAVSAATINAAYSLSCQDRIGSLEAGKDGDLLILGVPDYREIPYHFGINLVDLVMKKGSVVVKKSEVRWQGN